MNPNKVFKRYDIRGKYPLEINEEFSKKLGKAVGSYVLRNNGNRVVVSRDNRECSVNVKEPFLKGLRATGVNIVDIGEGPTDRLALGAKMYRGVGVQITASHLSWDKTGFKLVYTRGNGFDNEDLDEVKKIFIDEDFKSYNDSFEVDESFEFDETYEEEMVNYFDGLNGKGQRVVLDASGGPAKEFAKSIMEKMGFQVSVIERENPDPCPDPQKRKDVIKKVNEEDAILGIVFDPDADRVYIVHPEKGWIDGNSVIYTLIKLKDAEKVAVSVDSAEFIEETGADISYSRVGDIFVSKKGVDVEAEILGEPNGHYALTDFCWYNSGILVGAYIANNYAEFEKVLEEVPQHVTVEKTIKTPSEASKKRKMDKAMKMAPRDYNIINTIDGVKFYGEGFTSLVRPSGTSNKIRITVHGENETRVEEAAEEIYSELS